MNPKLTEYLGRLPDELQPLAARLVDSIANGLLENIEASIDTLILEDPETAYTQLISKMPTSDIVNMLDLINQEMIRIAERHKDFIAVQHMFFRQLILLALGFLQKEIKGD